MSAMDSKSDSVPIDSGNIITSTTTKTVETLNVVPTDNATETKHDAESRSASNDKVSPMTEIKIDEADGIDL